MPNNDRSLVRNAGNGVEVYQCNCGKEFKVTGYPDGYKFACPKCHAFCVITRNEDELAPGTRLGDFVVRHLIGRGGNGIVYLGRQLSLDRPVAIKALRPDAAAYSRFVKRFSQEARTAAQIVHSNVVQIYFVGRKESTFFIAMEYVDGRSVRQLINESRGIPERRAVELILQACAGLKRAHQMNVLHRDIKPDNLLVSRHGEVKVADFGLAMDLRDDRKQAPPRRIEGSPHYMSPEQAMRGETSFASDIYSLGATLYHMVTAEPPFTGNSPSAIIAKHVTDYPRSPREIRSHLSKRLCQVLRRMMNKLPEDRYPDMDALMAALRRLKNGTGTQDFSGGHWFTAERDDSSRLHEMMAIVEVATAISQERDLDQLLLRVVHEITQAMHAERSTLYVYDHKQREIWAKVAEGLDAGKVIRLPLGQGIAGMVAQEIRTVTINDPYHHPLFNRAVDQRTGYTTRNMICMPILGANVELLGVIQVLNKRAGSFDHGDESLLSVLAVHIGLTLENTLYYCPRRRECDIAEEQKAAES